MTHRRPPFLLLLPLVVFAALATLFYVGLQDDDAGGLASALLGKAAPALDLDPLGDELVPDNDDLRANHVKLVNFWASWCAPCRAEHPNLQSLNEQGLTILGVNYKDQPQHALDFLDELGNPFNRIGADDSGRTAINWGVYGVPETFVVDSNGIIRLRWAGPITSRALSEHILPALENAE
ncbi:MAG: DsbE family thiol:disulfide interchange protein [Rhodobacteraceae bacterium]|nr:DsbE family thiol:disulfide interchange protein [Paracoccaceae bacterium]MCY4197388.1 DsbE family thiol:disulfide interchange protein [Paracoccaceae bacterium]MCY4327400.1 DsbE family thiol:disulfide interchange protein [Paracoccaceae bacterium]